jgi:hypothetical protein
MLYPRIVAFEQYGRGLEGLAQRSTYRARWCARGPGGDPVPAPQLILGRRGPASLLVPVAAGPAVQSRTIIRLEAMIDARIDKALARLVSLQEYERVRATYVRHSFLCDRWPICHSKP